MNWDRETRQAFQAILAYQRASERFLEGNVASTAFNEAVGDLIQALAEPKIVERMKRVLEAGSQTTQVSIPSREEIEYEIRLASVFLLRRRSVKVFNFNLSSDLKTESLKPDNFVDIISQRHADLINSVERSRYVKPRLTKKKRKRKLAHASVGIAAAVGLIIANSYALPRGAPEATASYALAGAALIEAARNIAGEPD